MSKLAAKAYHPVNGSSVEIWEGFSWPCLFFGPLWFLYKGAWAWAAIFILLILVSFGIAWLVFPFFGNAMVAKSLADRGYLNEQQWREKQQPAPPTPARPSSPTAAGSVADELTKLASLRDQGVLTDEEFAAQKRRVLSG